MSLVGPRPLPIEESDACKPWHRRRLEITPGLTCIWQVSGRNEIGFEQWMLLDLRYVENWSFVLDLQILWKTWSTVIRGQAAY